MKILITGGLGFIFSHVTEHFLEKGDEVHVFDKLAEGSHPELRGRFEELYESFHFHGIDVSYHYTIGLIKKIQPDYIVHAAAISDVDYSIREPYKTIQENHQATLNVFEAARTMKNLKKLLYVSTDEVYGECDHAKSEDEIIFPRNPYSLSKAIGSLVRLAYDNTYPELKDKTCETRFCNVFGPRQDARKIIPAIVRALNGEGVLAMHNNGAGFRQYIHVKEIPPLIELLLEKGHRTYNITSGEGHTVLDLVKLATKIAGKPVPVADGGRQGMDMRYEMSSKRISEEFGWKPSVPFAQAFKEYLNENIKR